MVEPKKASGTPPPLFDGVIESYALTVGALREFLKGMPERDVVVRFPYASTTASVRQVQAWLHGRVDEDFVWDAEGWYLIAKAEKTNGWMCLTFNWRYWMYLNLYGIELSSIRQERVAEIIDETLGLAYSHYEAGLSREGLRALLPGLLNCRDRFRRRFESRFGLIGLLDDPVMLIQQALKLWDENPGYLDVSFIGGGFGLGGAIQGMANAHLLNSLVNSYNKKLTGQVAERVNLPLAYGFSQLRATQSILAGTLLFPRDALAEIHHGDGRQA